MTGAPSGSGSFSGSFLTPFIWNSDALTLAISANNQRKEKKQREMFSKSFDMHCGEVPGLRACVAGE